MLDKRQHLYTEIDTKEEVFDRAIILIENRLDELWIKQLKPFKEFWNKTKYFKEPVWINWIYFEDEDAIWISLSWQKDLRLILHELLHAYSSPNRDWIPIDEYYKKWDSDNIFTIKKILSEWTTELLARDIYNNSNVIIKPNEVEEIISKIKSVRNITSLKILEIRKNNAKEYEEYKKEIKNKNLLNDLLKDKKNSDKKYINELLENHYEEEKNLKVGKTYTSYDNYVIIIKSIINNLAKKEWITIEEVWEKWQKNYFNRDIGLLLQNVYRSWFIDEKTSFNIWGDLKKYLLKLNKR